MRRTLESGQLLAVVCVSLACGDGRGRDPTSTGDDGIGGSAATSNGGSGTTGSSGPTGDSGGDGPRFDVGDGETEGGGQGVCSSDLKRVLDASSGVVIETCPPDQGCLDGQCVPACDAAAGSGGSIGCEFIVPTSPFYANGNPSASTSGPCHALLLANTWDRPASLELGRGAATFDAQAFARVPSGITDAATYAPLPADGVPAGQVAVLFLSHRPGVSNTTSLECPVPPALTADTATHGTSSGQAFILTSDTPLQVYDIIPFGGASSYLPSASLIYPSTAWGTDYLAVSPHTDTDSKWMLVAAAQDGTTVTVQPTVPMQGGSIANPPAAAVTSYTINRGETLQWLTSALQTKAG